MSDDLTRRQLVRRAAALATVPLLARTLPGCAVRIPLERVIDVAAPIDGLVRLALSAAPELGTANGAVLLHPPGSQEAAPLYPSLLLIATSVGPPAQYLALQARCTHQRCEVSWVGADREAECPCHLSRFASDGNVVHPPAVVPLAVYPAAGDGNGNVLVQVFPGDGTFPDAKDGKVTLQLADYPDLQNEGGFVEGRSSGYPFPLVVIRLGGALKVLSAVCPHQGCTVRPGGDGFVCPCHGSQFTLSGVLTLGPAQSGLDSLATDPGAAPGTLVIPLPAL